MDFKIGAQIKCIKGHPSGLVLQGKNYTLLGMQYLCEHYPLILNVNHEPKKVGLTGCPHCKISSGGYWVCATRFAPLQENEDEEIKTEYKVVEVDKSLKEKREEVIFNN